MGGSTVLNPKSKMVITLNYDHRYVLTFFANPRCYITVSQLRKPINARKSHVSVSLARLLTRIYTRLFEDKLKFATLLRPVLSLGNIKQ